MKYWSSTALAKFWTQYKMEKRTHSCPKCEDGPEVELIKQFRVFPEGGEPAHDYPSDRYRR
jgi:hypothetical protein